MIKKSEIDYLNYNDLNEIEAKIDQLTEEISKVVISIPTYNKKTWILNELPFIQEIDRIEKAIYNLGEYYIEPKGWQTLKKWITDDNLYPIKSFDYRDWNRWINNLSLMDTSEISNMTLWDGNSLINWNEISDINWIDNNEILIKGKIIELLNKFKIIIKYLKLNGYTKQNSYSGKNKNVNAENVTAGGSLPAGAFTNLSEYDGYKNVVEVTSSIGYMTLRTNEVSSDLTEKIATGGIDITSMLLIKKTNANTAIKLYLGEITGGAIYKELKHYKDETNGWAWYYTTHTIPTNPSITTIRYHLSASNVGTFYIAKIQTLIGSTPSDFEPYVGGKASSSTEFPQNIEVATGSVSAKSTGKNLLNPNGVSKTVKGITLTNNGNGTFSVKGTSTSPLAIALTKPNIIVLESGKPYSNSIEILSGTMKGAIAVAVYNTAGKITYNYINVYSNNLTNTKTPSEDLTIKGYELYIGASGITVDFTFRVQLEQNDIATEYEPYKESSITYDLGDNFLADKDYIENGVLNKKIGKVVLNGSESGWKPFVDARRHYNYCINNPLIAKNVDKCWCNQFIFQNKEANNAGEFSIGGRNPNKNGNIVFNPSDDTTNKLSDFLSKIASNPLEVYFPLETPEQIQLTSTGELRTFEPNTIITNSLDSQMEIGYIEEVK